MSKAGLRDPFLKAVARRGYRAALGLHQRASALTCGRGRTPRLYYGGAPAGDRGGPKVKIGKLRRVFPEHLWTYNLIYVLSNAPYLPAAALRRLKGRGVPIASNQNGVFYPAWYGGDWEAENRRMAEQYHLADHVFHQSEFCRRSAEKFLGPRRGAADVLYNAVDTTAFVPSGRQRADTNPYLFLLAGKVQAHQAYRLEVSIEGLAAARRQGLEARIMVAGAIDFEALTRARTVAERLGVATEVTFAGPYRQAAAPFLFAAADAYIMTNHNDACPTSVIEAMACGLPVLHAHSGGVPELVGADAGVGLETGESWEEALVPAAKDVADGMLRVAENHQTLSAAARARAVERFDIAHWLDRHRQVFQDLLNERHG